MVSKILVAESDLTSFENDHIGNLDGLFASIVTYARPVRGIETALDQFLRLDSNLRPGLLQAEFDRLFAKCNCGLLMTRRVFRNHVCTVALAVARDPPMIIDLTGDDGGSGDFSGNGTSHIIIDLTADSEDEL